MKTRFSLVLADTTAYVWMYAYPNGQKGYYYYLCLDTLKQLCKTVMAERNPCVNRVVEEILRCDTDKWREIDLFMEHLKKQKLASSVIIRQVMDRFGCSYTTVWRKFKVLG